jgi:CIC family chloride channel protein
MLVLRSNAPESDRDERRFGEEERLADFTITPSALRILPLALLVGALAAGVALVLLRLIGLITHIFYYANLGTSLIAPSTRRFGALTILIPVLGGLIVGVIARFGSERIRGHGIPEAMERVLTGGSTVAPRLAILKPVASAISIGTGGPFGAEGPIIMTGGAFGSVIAQLFALSASERRSLLVAGACAGMAAVFGTPVAATLFGVELLVFEWRPRSLVPIALAVVVAQAIRGVLAANHLIGAAPLFPVAHQAPLPALGLLAAGLLGLPCALLAALLTAAVYGAEDLFARLPIHWMWWPALGGLFVGLGGMIEPRALGVGYPTIGAELAGQLALSTLATLLVVKFTIWSLSLGSSTSGGIIAPLLMMGAALGGLLTPILPAAAAGTWAIVAMAGTMTGVTRSPFTAVVFAFELTHAVGLLPALLTVAAIAHLLSTLVLKRSILTEKVARRGVHVMREYSVDPLEALAVGEVMISDIFTTVPSRPVAALREAVLRDPRATRQRLLPVLEEDRLVGVITLSRLLQRGAHQSDRSGAGPTPAAELMLADFVACGPEETLRAVADRMAERRLGALPVVVRKTTGACALVGLITVFELLGARERMLEEERLRSRVLVIPRRRRAAASRGGSELLGAP